MFRIYKAPGPDDLDCQNNAPGLTLTETAAWSLGRRHEGGRPRLKYLIRILREEQSSRVTRDAKLVFQISG